MEKWAIRRITRAGLPALLIAALVVSAASVCLAGTPVVGAEFGVANISNPAPSQQIQASVAYGGGVYLAVWSDRRSGTEYDVYGTFVDSSGNPTSTESFLISVDSMGSPLPTSQDRPAAAFNGTEFLVVWTGKYGEDAYSRVYASRVSLTGQVRDPNGVAVSGVTTVDVYFPKVASNGVDWEVVWQRDGLFDLGQVYAARVNSSGVPQNTIAIAATSNADIQPAIAWNGVSGSGSQYMVVWEDQGVDSDIYGCRVDSTGARVASSTILISSTAESSTTRASGEQGMPSISPAGGGSFLVVWEDDRNYATAKTDVYGARVSTAGALLNPGGIPISYGTDDDLVPQAAWNGASFVVTWLQRYPNSTSKIRGTRVSTAGAILDSGGVNYSNASAGSVGASIAGGPGGALVAWQNIGTQGDIIGCAVGTSGQPGPIKTISLSSQDQRDYAAAFNGSDYVAVWADKRDGVYQVYAARCTPTGTVTDPSGVRIAATSSSQTQPAIATDGTNFLVVWTQQSTYDTDIRGMILGSNLSTVAADIGVSTIYESNQSAPAVAWNGTTYTVVWQDERRSDGYVAIYGTRVTTTGSVQTETAISTVVYNQMNPAIAAGASGNCLVAWEDYRTVKPTVRSAIISSAGTVSGNAQTTTQDATLSAPSVAFDGTNYLVAWAADSYPNGWICAARMNSAGARVVPAEPDISVRTGASSAQNPSVCYTGTEYIVAWQDYRNAVSSYSDVYAAEIASDGTVLQPDGFVVSQAIYDEMRPVVVASGSLRATIYYSNYFNSVYRLRGRVCTFGEVPADPATIAQAKQLPDGTRIQISDVVVSAGNDQLPGRFYIEDQTNGNQFGIKVAWDSTTVGEGQTVTVTGIVETIAGERQLTASSVSISAEPGTPIRALGMGTRGMGGAAIGLTPGVKNGLGANNIGLLVRMWGRVRNPGGGYFDLDDASGKLQRVKWSGDLPAANTYQGVTGISSCEPSGSDSISVLLVRKSADVNKLQQSVAATIAQARQASEGTEVSLTDVLVSAGTDQLTGRFYIEDRVKLQGIKVAWSGTIHEGDVVSLVGTVDTVSGERQVTASSVSVVSTGGPGPTPVAVVPTPLGGVANGRVPGVTKGKGLNNIGLLVKTWGRVKSPGSGCFYLDCGRSTLQKVVCPYSLPTAEAYYAVTGISSCTSPAEGAVSLLLVRKTGDMVPFP